MLTGTNTIVMAVVLVPDTFVLFHNKFWRNCIELGFVEGKQDFSKDLTNCWAGVFICGIMHVLLHETGSFSDRMFLCLVSHQQIVYDTNHMQSSV